MWNILIVNCIPNSCIWNTCVTWEGTDYKLSEDDRIVPKHVGVSLISNFCRVLNAVCFRLGNSPASELPRELPRRKHTACTSVIICETTVHLLVSFFYNCPKYFWAVNRSTTLLPNVKNILGHFHGEMQNFLEPQFFNTGCQMYSKNVNIICLFMMPAIKRRCPSPDAAMHPKATRCHQHFWLLDESFLTQFFPQLFSTHN
jgi:hypothetical protein